MRLSIASNIVIHFLFFIKFCTSFVFTNANYDGMQVGVPFPLTWEDAEGPIALGLLYKNTSSSAQETYVIATNITASQFAWTPPDWTARVFAQKIEAQDGTNLTLTSNFTIAKAATAPIPSSVATKIATTQPISTPTDTTNAQSNLSTAAKARIGAGICIVVVLVIIGVALVFFEHGKRVAAKSEQMVQPKSPFGRAEQGLGGLELVETQGMWKKDIETEDGGKTDTGKEGLVEPSTPLLVKKLPPRPMEREIVVELDGMRDTKREGNDANAGGGAERAAEERRNRILSVRSIYELG